MATGGFLSRSGPVEIILRILQCCQSTRDLLVLISTCRHVYHVWRGNAAAALWPVWLREMPHFQDALRAARMTELVVEAERLGECPPTRITPDQLEQQRQQPTLSELRAAFGLHRLSRAIAACLCSQALTYPEDRQDWRLGRYPPPEDPARMPEWTARVSHAVLQLLIVGAALAGAYKEPLFKALEHPDPEVQNLPRCVPQESVIRDTWRETLGQKEMAFLLQFAVCDLDATLEAQDAVFGPIADWLLESILFDKEARQAMADRFKQRRGRATFCLGRLEYEDEEMLCPLDLLTDGRGTHSDAHLVVWELMKMLWLVDKVYPCYGEGVLNRHTPRPPSTTTQHGDAANEHNQGPLESAVAVFFGMFRAEETLLTARPPEHRRESLITYPVVRETKEEKSHGDEKLPSSMSVTVFFDYLFKNSGRSNNYEERSWLVPPLELEFFEYFLQRHLGLCLHCGAFRDDPGGENELLYQQFVGTATIFSHDDVEKRCALDGDHLEFADFLDGSEMLEKLPPDMTRVYFQGWT